MFGFKTINTAEINLSGDVPELEVQLNDLYSSMNIQYPKFYKMNLLCKLGFLTCEKLIPNGWKRDVQPAPDKIATIFFNKYASLASDHFHHKYLHEDQLPSPSVFVYTLPNILNGELAIRHGWTGYNAFFAAQNEEEMDYVLHNARISQVFDYVVTGWVETDLSRKKIFARMKLMEVTTNQSPLKDEKQVND